ncbi:hypothetical protein CDIK_2512 [Cucumispora dikerogammari]|nr:hypothetical protein CDIK_2512 [Cucumispora dikerogammari]
MKTSKHLLRQNLKCSEDIQKFVNSNKSLKTYTLLNLSLSSLEFVQAVCLSLKIKEMSNLKHITFSINQPYFMKKTIAIFEKLFENITPSSIQSLNLSSSFNLIQPPGVLWRFLKKAQNLRYLNIHNCSLRTNQVVFLLKILIQENISLKYLDLSSNNIDWRNEGPGPLLNQLSSLEILNIRLTYKCIWNINVLIAAIKDLRLRELFLSFTCLDEPLCLLLGKMFRRSNMIRLAISHCYFSYYNFSVFLKTWCRGNDKLTKQSYMPDSLSELALRKLDFMENKQIGRNILSLNVYEKKESSKCRKILDLSNNRLDQCHINLLAEFIENVINIKLIVMGLYNVNFSELKAVVERNSGVFVFTNLCPTMYHQDSSDAFIN